MTIEKIKSILLKYEDFLVTNVSPVYDYHSLKIQIIQTEFNEEFEELNAIFDSIDSLEDFDNKFQSRCSERAINNITSDLSFFSMSNGLCNKMYWEIAETLLPEEDKTVGAMLNILLPYTEIVITTHINDHKKNPAMRLFFDNINLDLRESSVLELKNPAKLNDLSNYISVGRYLFDVRDIANFNFELHQLFNAQIADKYPQLANVLYQHNDAFKNLHHELLLISKNGRTPLEVIKTFINSLYLGGGNSYASNNAHVAVNNFAEYLDSLPENFRENILNSSSKNKSIAGVMKHLSDGQCVELAALYLQEILDNVDNKGILTTLPHITQEHLNKIKKQYKLNCPISTEFNCELKVMPEYFLEMSIGEIFISDLDSYFDLLLAFPPHLYEDIVRYATFENIYYIHEAIFKSDVRNGLLNQTQIQAFDKAVIVNHDKFASLYLVLGFFNDNLGLIVNCLTECYSKEYCLSAIEAGMLLFLCVDNHELLKEILELYPEKRRFDLINAGEKILLHKCYDFPESLKIILSLLPKEDLLPAIMKEDNSSGANIFYIFGDKPDLLKFILDLLPVEDRFFAITKANKYKIKLLHLFTIRPKSLEVILGSLPEDDRLKAINDKDSGGNMVMHLCMSNVDTLKIILNLLPEKDRLAAVNEKNKYGKTLFEMFSHKEKAIEVINDSLSFLNIDKIYDNKNLDPFIKNGAI